MARNYDLSFLETSAKTDSNVYDTFANLTKEIMRKKGLGIEVKQEDPDSSKLDNKPVKQKKCC